MFMRCASRSSSSALGVVGCSTHRQIPPPRRAAAPAGEGGRARFPIRSSRRTRSRARSREARVRASANRDRTTGSSSRTTRIDAELVPTTSRINGRETVRYFNRSPDTLRTLWIELNQNLFAPSSPRVVDDAGHRRHGDSARRRGRSGAGESRHGHRLLGLRDVHASRTSSRSRAARLGRSRHRVGVSASARRRAARGHDRRRLHGRVLVSAARRLRRRHRLADRSVPRQRRVLHGVRGLRRESQPCRKGGSSRRPGS